MHVCMSDDLCERVYDLVRVFEPLLLARREKKKFKCTNNPR